MKTVIIAAALSVLALNAVAADVPATAASAPTKEVCVKKDKKGACLEKKTIKQPKKNPVEEKKKKDAEKAAAKKAKK